MTRKEKKRETKSKMPFSQVWFFRAGFHWLLVVMVLTLASSLSAAADTAELKTRAEQGDSQAQESRDKITAK
jgi:hypothetical protein